MRVTLACPKCRHKGWVEWNRLGSTVGCPKCGCQFLVTQTGDIRACADLPQTRYQCPRCNQSGSVPTVLATRGIKCRGCSLPLIAGPDNRLHGVHEAKELRRLAGVRRSAARPWEWLEHRFVTPDGRIRLGLAATCCLGLVVSMGCAVIGAVRFFDTSVESTITRFTRTCLAANWTGAEAYFADDPVEREEFKRWRMRHFSAVIDKYRPSGDSVTICVEPFENVPDDFYRVTITSDFLGSRSFTQCWANTGGSWQFQAQRTIDYDSGISR